MVAQAVSVIPAPTQEANALQWTEQQNSVTPAFQLFSAVLHQGQTDKAVLHAL